MTSREEVWDELRDEMVNDTTYTGEAAHWKYVSVTERLARREAEARVKELEIDLSKPPQEREYCRGCLLPAENARLRRVFEIPHKEGER